jgi:hypothetical protein
LTECQKVCSFGASGFVASEPSREEQSISYKVIVEVVVNLRPKLGDDVGIGRGRHDVSMQNADVGGKQMRGSQGDIRQRAKYKVEEIGSEGRSEETVEAQVKESRKL